MKLTVIGSRSGYPLVGEATSCYLIQDKGFNVVVDLGSGSLSKLQAYIEIEELDAVIITHYHPDHFSDIYCLQQAVLIKHQLGMMANPLKVYGPEDAYYFKQLTYETYMIGEKIDGKKKLVFDNLTIDFMETEHSIYSLAVKLSNQTKNMVYTSDTELTPDLVAFCKDIDLLICECSLYQRNENISGHMAIEDVKQLIGDSKPQKALITHLPPYGDNQKILEGMGIKNVLIQLARDGLVCEL